MKLGRAICVVTSWLIWQVAAPVQFASAQSAAHTGASSSQTNASPFEPLDRWKAAVLAGDRTALGALYSSAPPAQNQTPAGKTQDANEEPQFWSALAAQGLSDFHVKVLEVQRPQPGVVSIVLRAEFKLKANSGEQPFVVGAAEIWLQQGNEWRIVQSQRGDPAPDPPRRLPEPAKPNTDLYPRPEEAQSEISTALAVSAKDHKRVILVFGGNWCYDCHVLDTSFHSKAIAPLVNANFHVVHINIGDEDKNLDLAAKYGVPLNKGVPALAVLDSNGNVLYSQKQGEFENSVRIGPDDVTAFLKKWAPPHPS
jgi:thioredoxin 1